MKREKVDVTYTCDLCRAECQPVRELRLLHSYGIEFNNEIVLTVSAYIPYGTSDGDVCPDCLMAALERYVESERRKREPAGRDD